MLLVLTCLGSIDACSCVLFLKLSVIIWLCCIAVGMYQYFMANLISQVFYMLNRPHLKKSYISLRKNSKLKERKLLGSRKSCKHNYKLNRPHLKKTKVCCARPKRKWRGCIPSLKRPMHCYELSWNFRKIEVGMHTKSEDDAFA